KTPIRIPIAGGGTDLPSIYSKNGSYYISAAIDKYIYIIVQERKFHEDFLIKYSITEKTKNIDTIKNELVRESLKLLEIDQPLEIVSIADLSGQTGLGSSASFTVGLLNALHAYKREVVSPIQIAEESCHITMDILKLPSGKQDEYICATGGFTSFKISKTGRVKVVQDGFDQDFLRELEHCLYIFYTGITRNSKNILKTQKEKSELNNLTVINNLKATQLLGYEIRNSLKDENYHLFGELLHKHWLLKRRRNGTTNVKIDRWYDLALRNGAVGGKIMGAGGGGFFLFYCEKDAPHLINILEKSGLKHIPFNFDWNGTRIIANF
ncbi:MAG: galactokinase, partial [Candidatus Woesebacteria bacterium]|nr:galactokinase [Candidatus Woesebacteria bacterium]